MLESLLEFLIQGLVLGGLYALFAVGLSLIFGVLDVINVAHGEFFAVGGYLAFAAVVLLHLPGAAGVLGAAVGTFLLGLCVSPLLIAPLKRRLGGRPQGPLYLVLYGLKKKVKLRNASGHTASGSPFIKMDSGQFLPGATVRFTRYVLSSN